MLYDNTLIDINRIRLPLNLFRETYLPIRKMIQAGKDVSLIVKIASLNKIFKDKVKDIPLLNAHLVATYFNFPSQTAPIKYIYKSHSIVLYLQPSIYPLYDILVLPLSQFGLIKDFYFAITDKLDQFMDNLIEIEILSVANPKNITLLTKVDSYMLNKYIPLTKLGHILPEGVYYYSFSDPEQNNVLGGLLGKNYVIQFKTKKAPSIIKFYLNQFAQLE